MKIGIYRSGDMPMSLRVYLGNIGSGLLRAGHETVYFGTRIEAPPGMDLYWDPRASGGGAPPFYMASLGAPLVVTLHGVAPFALKARECYVTFKGALRGKVRNLVNKVRWRALRGRYASLITVSNYSKVEIVRYLGLDPDSVTPIYHGVDHDLFKAGYAEAGQEPYFMHISAYNPKKNIKRLFEAHAGMEASNRPKLLAIVPGYRGNYTAPDVKIIKDPVSNEDLAAYYRGALAFVFPSLHEGFGMPIVEAMSCGVPVITSNGTACAEVAGDAAMLVDPRSTASIREAMLRISRDVVLREELSRRSTQRAGRFTWTESVARHIEVFGRAAALGRD